MTKTVAIVGTLDTKGNELKFVKDLVESEGVDTIVINASVLGEPLFEPDVSAKDTAAAGGGNLDDLVAKANRGRAIDVMSRGAGVIARELFDAGKIDGIISLGGSAGTTIGASAMRALPVGPPKVMVSTLASGDTRPYVGTRDIAMIYSVVDIAGINRISRQILSNAAGAMVGMLKLEPPEASEDKPIICATMFGVTTPCVTKARATLEAAGYEALVFHATGTGGRAMEDLVKDGFVAGVLDITTTELADELVGGVLSAGPERLEAAGAAGVPQVVVPGAIDMVNFGPRDAVPPQFAARNLYEHNPTVTLMRTTKEENEQLGEIMGKKLSKAQGPTTVLIPKLGLSAIDAEGEPFYDAQADEAFLQALRSNLGGNVELIEMENHINDDEFAEKAVCLLLRHLEAE